MSEKMVTTDAVLEFTTRREYLEAKDVLQDAEDRIASAKLTHWVNDAEKQIWIPVGKGVSVIKGLFDKEGIKYNFRLGASK